MEISKFTEREINQGVEVVLKTLANYNKYLKDNGLIESEDNYFNYMNNHIEYQYTKDEIVEIVDLFLVDVVEGGCNAVLVDKNNEDNVTIFNRDVKWKWNYDVLEIHIWDRECSISINIDNVVELDDEELDLGEWILRVM